MLLHAAFRSVARILLPVGEHDGRAAAAEPAAAAPVHYPVRIAGNLYRLGDPENAAYLATTDLSIPGRVRRLARRCATALAISADRAGLHAAPVIAVRRPRARAGAAEPGQSRAGPYGSRHRQTGSRRRNSFKPWRLVALAFKALRRLKPDCPSWRDFPCEYEKRA